MKLYVIFQNYDIDYQPLGGTTPWMSGIFLSKEGAEKEMEDAEERKDNAINNRSSVIENYRKNWQAQP